MQRLDKAYRLCGKYDCMLEDRHHPEWKVIHSQQTDLQSYSAERSNMLRDIRSVSVHAHRFDTIMFRHRSKHAITHCSSTLETQSCMALLLCTQGLDSSSKQQNQPFIGLSKLADLCWRSCWPLPTSKRVHCTQILSFLSSKLLPSTFSRCSQGSRLACSGQGHLQYTNFEGMHG